MIIFTAIYILSFHGGPPETVYGGTFTTLKACVEAQHEFKTNAKILDHYCAWTQKLGKQ